MEKLEMNISDLILYKDNQIIVFNKPAGMLTQADDKEDKSLIDLAEIYCKHKVYPLHRLDRPAAGIVVFAKNKKALLFLTKQLEERTFNKTYLAWVKSAPSPDNATLKHFIKRNGKLKKAFCSNESKSGYKEAELKYKTIFTSDNYSLLEINLISGRFHQIRAQLSEIKSPIKGDVKYGARRSNADRSIDLLARSITFVHPTNGISQTITVPIPNTSLWQSAGLD